MRNKLLYLILLALTFGGCSKLLDQQPDSLLVRDEFWKSEGDVERMMSGTYLEVQGSLPSFLAWGEARSGYLKFSNNDALSAINEQELNAFTGFANWSKPYKAINYLNGILKFAPGVQAEDAEYTDQELNNHMGEAYFLRGLLHFYLIRTFYEIPYNRTSFDNDNQDFYMELTARDSVFYKIEEEFMAAEGLLDQEFTEPHQVKGRASYAAVKAAQADLYLWMAGELEEPAYYQKALDAANAVQGYALESIDDWFNKLYLEGNSSLESIYEIQFAEEFNNLMPTSIWTNYYQRVQLEPNNNVLFPMLLASNDTRAAATFKQDGDKDTSPLKQWKYVGATVEGEYAENKREQRDPNFIIYRYADVLLMKAEAMNNLGNRTGAIALVNEVRERSRLSLIAEEGETARELDEIILNERGRELAFEGKHWFDTVRIALRHGDINDPYNEGNSILTNRIIDQKVEEDDFDRYSWVRRLQDPHKWFWPIHYNELASNPSLRQFEWYQNNN